MISLAMLHAKVPRQGETWPCFRMRNISVWQKNGDTPGSEGDVLKSESLLL